MSKSAHVESIDALKGLRATLCKFAEAAHVALSDAESEIQRTLMWLETEQQAYWQSQIRKRTELLARAKEALRQKKIFKDSAGRTPSAVDEEKAVAVAQRRLSESEQKLVAVRRHAQRLQKEIDLYKGSVQRFATGVQIDVPAAVAHLDNLVMTLEAYAGFGPVLAASNASESAAAADQPESMARPAQEPVAGPPPPATPPASETEENPEPSDRPQGET